MKHVVLNGQSQGREDHDRLDALAVHLTEPRGPANERGVREQWIERCVTIDGRLRTAVKGTKHRRQAARPCDRIESWVRDTSRNPIANHQPLLALVARRPMDALAVGQRPIVVTGEAVARFVVVVIAVEEPALVTTDACHVGMVLSVVPLRLRSWATWPNAESAADGDTATN